MLAQINQILFQSQSLALCDLILMPEWENRYFSFDSKWDEQNNEKMASMRDGEGNEYFILFNESGAIGKALELDQANNQPYDKKLIPEELSGFLSEPAFSNEYYTSYFWNLKNSKEWLSTSATEKINILKFLENNADYYKVWAENYYDIDINNDAIQLVFNEHRLSQDIIEALNPDVDIESLNEEINIILGQ